MKRYYYTDALAAAWMADKYGMIFLSDAGDKISWMGDTAVTTSMFGTFTCDGPLYIHPDSLHLLEPKDGDLVDGVRVGHVYETDGKTLNVDANGGDWEMAADCVTILQRNGIPFMRPEVENEKID